MEKFFTGLALILSIGFSSFVVADSNNAVKQDNRLEFNTPQEECTPIDVKENHSIDDENFQLLELNAKLYSDQNSIDANSTWCFINFVLGFKPDSTITEGPGIRYTRDGHQLTTYLIARAADYGRIDAYQLAYFSEFPDITTAEDEAGKEIKVERYDATYAAVRRYFKDKYFYTDLIMETLHSLHGGEGESVQSRRNDLQDFIHNGLYPKGDDIKLELWQIGLAIHALGDSFAHTYKIKGGVKKAYASKCNWWEFWECFGHLKHKHGPDIILSSTDRYNKYEDYVCSLYTALADLDKKLICHSNSILTKYFKKIKKFQAKKNRAKKHIDENTIESFMIEFMRKNHLNYDADLFDSVIKKVDVPSKEDIEKLLEKMHKVVN